MAPSMEIEPSTPTLTSPDTAPATVVCTAQNENGSLLATAHSDGVIKVWRRAGRVWKPVKELDSGHDRDAITSLAFAPSRLGSVVVTAAMDRCALVHSLADGGAQELNDALGPLFHAAFSGRGDLATVGDELIARVYVRDLAGRFRLAQALDVSASSDAANPGGLAFRPSGDALAAGGHIFARTPAGRWVEVPGPEVQGVRCVHWGYDMLVAGCADGALALCAAEPGGVKLKERLVPLGEAPKPVVEVEWDPVGAAVAAVHEDGVVRTWCRAPSRDPKAEKGVWTWQMRDCVDCATGGPGTPGVRVARRSIGGM